MAEITGLYASIVPKVQRVQRATGKFCIMSSLYDKLYPKPYMPTPAKEIEGTPQPGVEKTADKEIYKVMIEQKREISRKKLPKLPPP